MSRRKFSNAFLQRLKPPASGRVEYFDITFPAFGLRLTETGVASWFLFYRSPTDVNAKTGQPIQRRLTLGRYPLLGLADARTEARKGLEAVAHGVDPAKKVEKAPTLTTFGAVAQKYKERHLTKLKPRSAEEGWRPFKNLFLPRWKDRPLADIRRGEVWEVLDELLETKRPHAANRSFAMIRAFFRWSVGRGYLDANPIELMERPAEPADRERHLSDDEIRAVWRACDVVGYPFGPFVQMLLVTGQRRSEVSGMRFDEIEGDVWVIPKTRIKNNQPQVVPLTPLALAIIDAVPKVRSSPYVFTTSGRVPIGGFSKAKRELDKAADISEGWRLHDLRRTMTTRMGEIGIDPFEIRRVLNHSMKKDLGVTATYLKYDYATEKRRALQAWADRLSVILDDGETVVSLSSIKA